MLHENIRAIRKSMGLSQEDLAVKLHVVRQTISKWETGSVGARRRPADRPVASAGDACEHSAG